MSLPVSRWPFVSAEERTPEQEERWWTECYVPSPADVTLRGIAHSVIAVGGQRQICGHKGIGKNRSGTLANGALPH